MAADVQELTGDETMNATVNVKLANRTASSTQVRQAEHRPVLNTTKRTRPGIAAPMLLARVWA
jgi:hypothetical protein